MSIIRLRMMNLIKSGVKGLDNILKGGLKENSNILVTGAPGTGKTILCLQFANEGIKNKEPVLFVATEEFKEAIFEYAKTLGLNNLINNKLFMVLERTDLKSQIKSLTDPIKLVKQHKVKRIVFDSITFFDYLYFKNELEYRTALMDFLHEMKSNKVTTIMTSQKETIDVDQIKYPIQDFLFDGVILLTRVRKGSSFERVIHISKMRGQDHSLDIYPLTINKNGIEVHYNELPFSLIEQDESKDKFG